MNDILQQFMGHDSGPVIQFIKYAIAGGVATAVDVVAFYFLSWRILPALKEDDPLLKFIPLKIKPVEEHVRSRRFVINTAIAFIFSNFSAYLINILWVFESGRHSWPVELALFYAVSGISLAIGTAIGWVLIKRLHLSTTASYIAKGVSALLVNFVCRKFIIFRA